MWWLVACIGPKGPVDTDTGAASCGAVTVAVTPVDGPEPAGVVVPIHAETTGGVVTVSVLYRDPDLTTAWIAKSLAPTDDGSTWNGAIAADDVQPTAMDWYVTMADPCGDVSCAPSACDASPYSFEVDP